MKIAAECNLVAAAVALAVTLAPAAHGQTGAYQVVGPNAVTYQALTGGTQILSSGYSQLVNLGFDFNFYGETHSSVTVSLYGYLAFAGSATSYSNQVIPHSLTSGPQAFIAPWWDDLTRTTGTTVRMQTSGIAPFRVTTIEWRDVVFWGSTSLKFSFQAQLYETTGQIRFIYGPVAPGTTSSASIGIQKELGVGVGAQACSPSCGSSTNPTAFATNKAIDFFRAPDLLVGGLGGDQLGYAGVTYRSSARVQNVGGREVSNVIVRFYLSNDSTWDTGDAPLGESQPITLAAGQEQLVTGSGAIPAGTAPGSYFLFAVADPNGAIPEQDEGNNVSAPIVAKVGAPTPDLVVAGISSTPATVTPGGSLQIQRVITNIGNAAVTAPFSYTYFVSDNSVVTVSDRRLSPVGSIASLAAGASDNKSETLALPANLPAGKYWVGVCADYSPDDDPPSKVAEINEVANCATAPAGFILDTGSLTIITPTLPEATQHSPYGLPLQATGGDGSYAWTLTGGQLPAGVSLSAAGQLLGTPSTAGSFGFSVKVASGGAEATANLSLQVIPANIPLSIADQQLPSAQFGRLYEARLVAVGGKPPYLWKVTEASKLPAGLALSEDGTIEGRAYEVGEVPFSIELTDSAGTKASKDLVILVTRSVALQIATARLATGYLRKEYSQPLQAVGGRPPYDWSVVQFQQLAESPAEQPGPRQTALPANFGLIVDRDSDGRDVFRGVPTRAGLFAITWRVQDSAGSEDITTLPLLVSYDDALGITTLTLPDAFVGHPYSARLSHSGGPQVVDTQFSIACMKQVALNLEDFGCAASEPSQMLPPGLFLDNTGQISGTPAPPTIPGAVSADGTPQPVTYSFLVRLSDMSGRQDLRSLSIKVRPDFNQVKQGGCAGGGMAPSLLSLLALAGLGLGRRRR